MKYLILGGGPAGLTFANRLKQNGCTDFLVLESQSVAGGLCRSVDVDGAPFDIGGGHFLDVRRPHVNEFLFQFMPESEWNLFDRDSQIVVNGNSVNHPIEANIWQMKLEDQVEYLKSIAIAGCNLGTEMPKQFIDWIYWKLGKKIAEDYMLPYNQKMFSKELNSLGTYWLEKLPNVSFDETLLSCLKRKAYGQQPGHAQFYYPKKHGYGELWLRMAENIKDSIEYEKHVVSIDFESLKVKTSDGEKYQAQNIISTIPWIGIEELNGMPSSIKNEIKKLKHNSVQTSYYSEKLNTNAHWIYYPDPKLSYHRILVRHNFAMNMNSRGYWTETNSERINLQNAPSSFQYMNDYAYPLNTLEKPQIMSRLLEWTKSKNVFGLGRWGEHEHYNSDVTAGKAMDLADQLYSK